MTTSWPTHKAKARNQKRARIRRKVEAAKEAASQRKRKS